MELTEVDGDESETNSEDNIRDEEDDQVLWCYDLSV